jgi:hypothetical protein
MIAVAEAAATLCHGGGEPLGSRSIALAILDPGLAVSNAIKGVGG